MKRFFIPVLLSLLSFASCTKDQTPDGPSFVVYGNSISGVFSPQDRHVNESTNSIDFYVRPYEIDYFNLDPIGTDAQLYYSVIYREKLKGASSLDEFALGIILERESEVEKKFKDLVELYQLENQRQSTGFVSAYVRGVPTITADDTFLGQPAGADLSDYFLFSDPNILGIFGTDWKVSDRMDMIGCYQKPSDFFEYDKMVPLSIRIRTVGLPEEVSLTSLNHYGGDNPIIVTIEFPVTFERYWAWCKALYTNPDAVEKFQDGYIRATIPFDRK